MNSNALTYTVDETDSSSSQAAATDVIAVRERMRELYLLLYFRSSVVNSGGYAIP